MVRPLGSNAEACSPVNCPPGWSALRPAPFGEARGFRAGRNLNDLLSDILSFLMKSRGPERLKNLHKLPEQSNCRARNGAESASPGTVSFLSQQQ